jgi:hypothetical protein
MADLVRAQRLWQVPGGERLKESVIEHFWPSYLPGAYGNMMYLS